MAYQTTNSFTTSSQCGEDLSANQFQFVTLGSDGQIYAARNTDMSMGVLTDVPSIGPDGQYSATVATAGTTRICVINAYPIGTYLVPYYDGTTYGVGASVSDASSEDRYIRARTLQASSAAYEIVACELLYNPYGDAAGAQGLTGLNGVTGAPGVTGSNGIQGITGLNGVTGAPGVTGSNGIQGITGSNGIASVTTMISLSAAAGTGITGPHTSPTSYIWANLNGVTGVLQFYSLT